MISGKLSQSSRAEETLWRTLSCSVEWTRVDEWEWVVRGGEGEGWSGVVLV